MRKKEMIVKRKNGTSSIKKKCINKKIAATNFSSLFIYIFFVSTTKKNNYCRFLKQIVQG